MRYCNQVVCGITHVVGRIVRGSFERVKQTTATFESIYYAMIIQWVSMETYQFLAFAVIHIATTIFPLKTLHFICIIKILGSDFQFQDSVYKL